MTNKRCNKCGTTAPDEASAFCNKCGARLPVNAPAPVLTCRKCGSTSADPLSRFCNTCGSPMAATPQAASPAIPAAVVAAAPAPVKGTPCPTCGFENVGENRFYCKKCGTYIPIKTSVQKFKPDDKASVRGPQDGPARARARPGGAGAAGPAPVIPAVQPGSPKIPAAQEKICPACGFKNHGETLYYCKKCGASLLKNEPFIQRERAGEVPGSGLVIGGIRIRPDGMDELRQNPVYGAIAQPAVPPGKREPGGAQRPVYAPAAQQELPPTRRQEAPRKKAAGSWRRVTYGVAGVLLLVLVIAVIALVVPGVLNTGAANSTAPGVFEALSLGIQPNQTPVITEAIPASTIAKTVITTAKPVTTRTTPVLNQATTVITDTPLTLAVT